ncbi:hypothetical protein [Treponema pedis]|uniref:Uncharacterized protein n=2 Tax=Treponema pedis TaxID=409322 RepID=S6A0A0_9SPIR|nr:hypothetical protein [Treponema pedis]AGT44088.1 hypothetical protein TPE_1598 [Treponema pedis str. T A4]QSI04803.1 hypothetical protein DYQ05_07620 [Treponema pedis]
MLSKFFKENILPLLHEDSKDFISYTGDLMKISFMIDKERNVDTPEIQNFFLGDVLFNYKMSKEEMEYTLNIFKDHIRKHTKYDLFCVSLLGKYPDEKEYNFLFEQLKLYMPMDIPLSVELIKACNNYTVDEEFIYFLKELQHTIFQKEFRKFITDIINFYEHRISVLDFPMVYYDNYGNNKYVQWG